MIKKLRIKLIAVSMLSLFLVLLVIIGTVNILNYRGIVENADNTLSVLAENDGTFPVMRPPDGDFHGQEPPDDSIRPPKGMSPELPYESRFFSVLLDGDGNELSVDTGRIAAVDSDTAVQYAQSVLESGRTSGFLRSYRFIMTESGDGTRIIFLDCGRSLSTFRSFLLTSCGISFLGMLAVLLLMILLSGRIVKPISESYEKQKQFITDAGHEIKTPITIIDADAEVMEMEVGKNEWLDDIKLQTKRLTSLTNDLIFLSRMEEEQSRIQLIELPFSDLVSETAQSFQSRARTQNKSFTVDIQPMLSICGDEKLLRQLVSILLDNAIKYSPPEGSISVALEKQGRNIRLAVANTVESVSKDGLEHMFDRFYREDKSRSSSTGGYGIGLSIAKAVVTAHKGRISASSPDGRSLVITVLLPERI